ncbi:hypothetical protein [Novosphingobium sp. P6W]|uniref:hypothetical protein n=1 Tax=Novosphingobium sp. P6W TaxID=1609758 RepID=UPI003515F2F4
MDARTGFSSLLLGREAAGADELQALYAAILALGTDKTAAEMARMVDGVSDDRIELRCGRWRTTAICALPATLWPRKCSPRPLPCIGARVLLLRQT